MPRSVMVSAVVLLLGCALIAPTATSSSAATPIEDYASYQPQTKCSPKAKPGTKVLGHWLVRKYGGGYGPISRRCSSGTSEHQEGRAFDWTLDARKNVDRKRARAFMERVFREDGHGNADAWARRMGIIYLIWSDTMYPAWNRFRPEPYLSSSCPSKRRCSATLRHRNHLHVSLTRAGGKGRTSWYDGRLPSDR